MCSEHFVLQYFSTQVVEVEVGRMLVEAHAYQWVAVEVEVASL